MLLTVFGLCRDVRSQPVFWIDAMCRFNVDARGLRFVDRHSILQMQIISQPIVYYRPLSKLLAADHRRLLFPYRCAAVTLGGITAVALVMNAVHLEIKNHT